MDVGIPVEVEGLYGEFYPGIVCGLNSLEEFRVNIIDPSHSNVVIEVALPPSALRLPPVAVNFPFEPTPGQEVDVLIPCVPQVETGVDSGTHSPLSKLSAWWPGRVKKIAGGFVIFELTSTFQTEHSTHIGEISVSNYRLCIPLPPSIEKTDVVEKHQLRLKSHEANFCANSFHTHSISIPDQLVQYCKDPANYQHFARRCGSPVLVCMPPESSQAKSLAVKSDGETYDMNARLLVISTDLSVVNRAAVIDNTFIDMLRQKVFILQQTEELSRKLEVSKGNQQSMSFYEEVHVPEQLLPHAIGYQCANLRRATALEGIISIKIDRHACVFQISGKTLESVDAAKAILDYTTEIVHVPRVYVNPILGAGRRHLQHIVDCVGLRGWKISDSPQTNLPDFVAFELTGTAQSVSDAKIFLDFHITGLQELDKLRGVDSPVLSNGDQERAVDEHTNEDNSSDGDSSCKPERVSGDQPPLHHGRRQKHRSVSSQNGGDQLVTQSTIPLEVNTDSHEGHAVQHQNGGPPYRNTQQHRGRRFNQTNNNAPNRFDGNPARRGPDRNHSLQKGAEEPGTGAKRREQQRNGISEIRGGSDTRRSHNRVDQYQVNATDGVSVAVPTAI